MSHASGIVVISERTRNRLYFTVLLDLGSLHQLLIVLHEVKLITRDLLELNVDRRVVVLKHLHFNFDFIVFSVHTFAGQSELDLILVFVDAVNILCLIEPVKHYELDDVRRRLRIEVSAIACKKGSFDHLYLLGQAFRVKALSHSGNLFE